MDVSSFFPQDSSDTRQRLLEAAILCFAEKGYDGTGIREIAQRAKANSALVQYYFGGKDGLHLAVLRFIMQHLAEGFGTLQPVPEAEAPGARAQALQAFRSHVGVIITHALECLQSGADCSQRVQALLEAAAILLDRESMSPKPEAIRVILETIDPLREHLGGCIRILRPDLDEEDRFLMGMSIHAQLFHLHKHAAFMAVMPGGRRFTAADRDRLVEHFTEFCLRGLGVPEAFFTPFCLRGLGLPETILSQGVRS